MIRLNPEHVRRRQLREEKKEGIYMADVKYDSRKKSIGFNFKELYDYRDLFLILAYRDLRVRYAQTFLGLFWAFLQPAATLLIFILIFGKAINVDTGNIP